LSDERGQFGRVPVELVDAGIIAASTLAEVKVLMVICRYMNAEGWAWPSVDTIAAGAGLDRRSVQRAVRSLEARQVLEVRVGGGRARPTAYRLDVYGGTGAALSTKKTAAWLPPIQGGKGGVGVHKGRQIAPETAAPVSPEQREQVENRARAVAAALEAVGVEPGGLADELAAAGVTAASASGVIAECLRRGSARNGAPSGVKVNAIRQHVGAAVAAEQKRFEREAADAAAAEAENRRLLDVAAAWFERIDGEKLEAVARRVCERTHFAGVGKLAADLGDDRVRLAVLRALPDAGVVSGADRLELVGMIEGEATV